MGFSLVGNEIEVIRFHCQAHIGCTVFLIKQSSFFFNFTFYMPGSLEKLELLPIMLLAVYNLAFYLLCGDN